jgi:hypothetical protein
MQRQAVEYYDSHVHSRAENAYDSVLVSVKYMLKNQCHLRVYGFLYCICLLFFCGSLPNFSRILLRWLMVCTLII